MSIALYSGDNSSSSYIALLSPLSYLVLLLLFSLALLLPSPLLPPPSS